MTAAETTTKEHREIYVFVAGALLVTLFMAFTGSDRASYSPLAAAAALPSGDVYDRPLGAYPYPPGFFVLLVVPGLATTAGWLAVSAASILASLFAVSRILSRAALARHAEGLGLALLGTAGALGVAALHGDPTLLVLALVTLTAAAYVTHRDELAGLGAGLATAIKLTPALLLLYFAWKGRWRVVAWSVIGLALFGALAPAAVFGRALAGQYYGEFFELLVASIRAMPPHELAIAGALAVALLVLARPAPDEVRLSPRVLLELGAASALMLLASPGAGTGHFVLLLLPFAATANVALAEGSGRRIAVVFALAVAASVGALVPDLELLLRPAAVGLLLFSAFLILLERRKEALADAVEAPTDLEVSVFFPAYNEGGNIGRVVERALEVLPRIARRFEVIVVDDASRDDTPEVVRALAERHPDVVRHVRHEQNRGYGGAVKTGLAAARYARVFFSDGDGQFDLSELPRFVRPLAGGRADAVIGYRRKRRDPFIRKVNAYCWGALVRTLFGIGARDIDCAYKILPTALVHRLALKSEGALISTEILAKLERGGCRLVERAVTHLPRERGTPTGGDPRVILRAFRELFRFRRELGKFTPS